MSSRPTASGTPSAGGTIRDHAPAQPSGLRKSYTASSYGSSLEETFNDQQSPPASPAGRPQISKTAAGISEHDLARPGASGHAGPATPTETTSLLVGVLDREHVHEGPCGHGTFSPRPMSPTDDYFSDSHTDTDSEVSMPLIDGVMAAEARKKRKSWKKQLASRMKSKRMASSSVLAERHGVKDSALM